MNEALKKLPLGYTLVVKYECTGKDIELRVKVFNQYDRSTDPMRIIQGNEHLLPELIEQAVQKLEDFERAYPSQISK